MAEMLILPTSKPGTRVTRAISLPSLQLKEVGRHPQSFSYPASPDFHQPIEYPELPDDPRTWTSTHVAAYLTYSLALYPPAIINDLSRFVRADSSLDGRRFLRLKEDQLRYMGFNERWIKLIMISVKTLRRESLKGKILTTPIVEEPEPPLHDHGDENDGDERPEDEGAFSTTHTSSSSSASEKDTRLAIDNRWFINDLKETRPTPWTPHSIFNYDDAKSNDTTASALQSPLRWLMRAVRDTPLSEFVGPDYASGFTHGALVGGILVWACCKVAANWRD